MSILEKNTLFKTKNDLAYEYLKKSILNHDYMPGDRIVIKDIAKKLNFSDIPVREAVRRLESQGLIKIVPHIGPSVIKIDNKEMEEIYLIRSELEGLATRMAAKHIKKRNFNELEKILQEYERQFRSGEHQKLGELNKKFHMTLYRCCPYKRLIEMISDLWENSHNLRSVFLVSHVRAKKSMKEHRLILKTLRKGDGELASEIVKKQKMESWDILMKFMKN